MTAKKKQVLHLLMWGDGCFVGVFTSKKKMELAMASNPSQLYYIEETVLNPERI